MISPVPLVTPRTNFFSFLTHCSITVIRPKSITSFCWCDSIWAMAGSSRNLAKSLRFAFRTRKVPTHLGPPGRMAGECWSDSCTYMTSPSKTECLESQVVHLPWLSQDLVTWTVILLFKPEELRVVEVMCCMQTASPHLVSVFPEGILWLVILQFNENLELLSDCSLVLFPVLSALDVAACFTAGSLS